MPMEIALSAAGIGGALISANAAGEASRRQTAAADRATAALTEANRQTTQRLQPFSDVGKSALYTLADFYGLRGGGGALSADSLARFRESPDYKFALSEGIKGVNQGAAATGQLFSGATKKALAKYTSGLASTNLGNYLTRLRDLAGLGETASANSGNATLSTGRGLADTALARGEAGAAGTIGTANAINQGIGDTLSNLTLYRQLYGSPTSSSYGATPSLANWNLGTASQGFTY